MLGEVFVLDNKRPCLNCGAPWRVVIEAVSAEAGGLAVRPRAGTCSAHCWNDDFEGFDAALFERLDRGWHDDLWIG
jgi:hypothetical protein